MICDDTGTKKKMKIFYCLTGLINVRVISHHIPGDRVKLEHSDLDI